MFTSERLAIWRLTSLPKKAVIKFIINIDFLLDT